MKTFSFDIKLYETRSTIYVWLIRSIIGLNAYSV